MKLFLLLLLTFSVACTTKRPVAPEPDPFSCSELSEDGNCLPESVDY